MKYLYTAIFSIRGVNLGSKEGDIELVVDPAKKVRVVLTSHPDAYSYEADRMRAVGNLMIRALVGQAESYENKQRVTELVKGIQASRKKEFGNAPFLVAQGHGEVASFTASHQTEVEEFVVWLGEAPKRLIREGLVPAITAVICSLAAATDTVSAIKKIDESVVFFREEDGKPVYCFTFSVSGSAYVSRLLSVDQLEAIVKLYQLFGADHILPRVQRLLGSSLETEGDPLRSFLSAWAAMEILTNRLFAVYEEKFFKGIVEKDQANARKKYLDRIHEVMKDKYRLVDKLAALSFQLSPETADEDLAALQRVKAVRDRLLHGEPVDEVALPVKPVRDLAFKYLRLHLEEEKARRSNRRRQP